MADETKGTAGSGSARKLDETKVPAGVPVQTGKAAAAVTPVTEAETKKAVEAAGFTMVKKNPHVMDTDIFEAGDFTIGREPVAVPSDQVAALTSHKDKYGRQLVVLA